MIRFIFMACMLLLTNVLFAQEPGFKEGYIHTRDSADLYYRIYGSQGDTILFLHGGPGGNLETPIEGYLPIAAKHVIIAYDQRGGGRSTTVDSFSLTLTNHVEDIESVRQHFGLKKMTIYGLSWGGTPALFYAHKYPMYVLRLIIDGPMPPAKEPFDKERWDRYEIAVRQLCYKRAEAAQAKDIEAYITECKRSRGISWRVQYYDTANLSLDIGRSKRAASGIPGITSLAQRRTMNSLGNWDFRPIMPKVIAPTLLVTGSHAYPPIEHVLIWSSTMPNAKVLVIPNSGHETAQFENPKYFFKAIEEFLNGRWPVDSKD